MKNVLITTQHRGVFCCKVPKTYDLTPKTLTNLKDCRMVIKWRNGEGLQGMCKYGPTEDCMLSPQSGIEVIHDVTGVFNITDEAASKIWGDV